MKRAFLFTLGTQKVSQSIGGLTQRPEKDKAVVEKVFNQSLQPSTSCHYHEIDVKINFFTVCHQGVGRSPARQAQANEEAFNQ